VRSSPRLIGALRARNMPTSSDPPGISTPRQPGEQLFIRHHAATGRRLMLLPLNSLDTSFAAGVREGEHFTCFCAMDGRTASDDQLRSFCRRLLQQGCCYFCAWGPDSERVHDLMDEDVRGDNPPETYIGCVMTT
jgi:hypothetical protein